MLTYLRTVFAESFRELARNKVRSALTILGIAVGIAAFTCVVAIGNAGSSKIEEQLRNLGDNMIWVEAGARAKSGVRVGSRGSRTLIVEDALAIQKQIRGTKSVVPNVDSRTQV